MTRTGWNFGIFFKKAIRICFLQFMYSLTVICLSYTGMLIQPGNVTCLNNTTPHNLLWYHIYIRSLCQQYNFVLYPSLFTSCSLHAWWYAVLSFLLTFSLNLSQLTRYLLREANICTAINPFVSVIKAVRSVQSQLYPSQQCKRNLSKLAWAKHTHCYDLFVSVKA